MMHSGKFTKKNPPKKTGDQLMKQTNPKKTCFFFSLSLTKTAGKKKKPQTHVGNSSLWCPQVKSHYAQLEEALGVVTQERDFAVRQRNQLRVKLENLEQVLKVRPLPTMHFCDLK